MTLRIAESLLADIRRHGELAYPAECCGVLTGVTEPGKTVARLYPVANARTDDPHRYLIGPEAFQAAERAARVEGLEVIGFFHSHPDHPAEPSGFDVAQAWPWYSYLIVRVERGHAADLTSWVLDPEGSRMDPEPIVALSEV